ncbi:uncharacterized protein M6B38_362470 [Iris pallida]|uniref:Uncharacterized protein n=1 Tax=Iris pallida TaxID=29817 RepID=A0AAX6GIP3_IRIPA|nr:uncharacterized protein M6B38_362470 [Iris pallida]
MMIKRMVVWDVIPPTCIRNSCIINIYDKDDCNPLTSTIMTSSGPSARCLSWPSAIYYLVPNWRFLVQDSFQALLSFLYRWELDLRSPWTPCPESTAASVSTSASSAPSPWTSGPRSSSRRRRLAAITASTPSSPSTEFPKRLTSSPTCQQMKAWIFRRMEACLIGFSNRLLNPCWLWSFSYKITGTDSFMSGVICNILELYTITI